ncbi:hypothetical protein, partial [Enorma massiliensis]|uniref:hypothetical protein n=1 Tax=Enorma massiliensis TaxID=1472761 RepID=UPI003A9209CD
MNDRLAFGHISDARPVLGRVSAICVLLGRLSDTRSVAGRLSDIHSVFGRLPYGTADKKLDAGRRRDGGPRMHDRETVGLFLLARDDGMSVREAAAFAGV